jgi:tetratricopeptide (TPR) repeat protein
MLARVTQAEQLAAQAAQWQAAGRADMAVQLYGAALEQDPSKFAIRMQLAECLAALGQIDAAAEHYLMVAQAYAARGRQQECLAICERILAIAPQAFVYMSVGPMVRRIGRHARPICARAAEAHLAAGRLTDGLQILRLGAELDPHNPDVRRQLARIYQARHMKREAVEALSDAGNLLLQAKRYEDYVQVAEQILALEPRDLETLRDLPRVYLELRKPHDAVRMLGRLTKVSPGDIAGYEILAQSFALIGRNDKALSVLERLVEELGATGQGDKADAILNHARYWRPTDLGFLRSLKRMEVPRAKPQAQAPGAGPREAAPEGTVVLSIADLLVEDVKRHTPAPNARDVELTEAEGTLTLRLDDLILDEMQQAEGRGVAPTKPPPGSPPPPQAKATKGAGGRRDQAARDAPQAPGDRREQARNARRDQAAQRASNAAGGRASPPPVEARPPSPAARQVLHAPVDATMTLDTADLLEALTGEIKRSDLESPQRDPPTQPDRRGDETMLLATDGSYATDFEPDDAEDGPGTLALSLPEPVDEDETTAPPAGRAAGRSISELIYDDDDGEAEDTAEEEPEAKTLLHMKPLTAEDIARALAQQAATAQLAPPVLAPHIPMPQPIREPPPPSVLAPHIPMPQPIREPPPMSARARPHVDGPEDDDPVELDAPTMAPGSARPPMGDEAPTMARLTPLTAADIARALSQGSSTRPPPGAVNEDALTLPPPSARAHMGTEPEEPPLLPPLHVDEEEEEELTTTMEALRPEDFLRGPSGGRGDGGPGRR